MSNYFITKYQLFRLFSTLKKTELRTLSQFLRSPYFNTDPNCITLFEILRYYHPHFESKQLSKERIFWRLFPDAATYEDVKLRRYFSGLKKLIEQFLVIEQTKDPMHYDFQVLKVYEERLDYKTFQKKANKTRAYEEIKEPENELEWNLFQVQKRLFFHPNSDKYKASHPNFEKSLWYLDHLYVKLKLKFMVETLVRKNVLQPGRAILMEQAILDAYEQLEAKDFLTELYYKFFQLFKQTTIDEQIYEQTKAYFLTGVDDLSLEEQRELNQFLVNYTINCYKLGYKEYALKQLELHNFALEKGYYIEQGHMKFTIFLNIVVSACAAKAFDFVDSFFSEYELYLADQVKEDTIQLAKGYLHFSKGAFDTANLLALGVQHNNIAFIVRARSLCIRCQYEFLMQDSEQYDTLVSSIRQFNYYLEQNKELSDGAKRSYLGLITLIHLMAKAYIEKNPQYRMQIDTKPFYDFLEQEPKIISKIWLLEKIKALE